MSLDRCTFEQLFRELYLPLLRYCTQILRNQVIAEEIVQERFIYLWENKDKINVHTSYKSYLYTSVKNKSTDYLRSRYAKIFISYQEIPHILGRNASPSQSLEYREFSEIVTKAVEKLPKKCFTVFSLKRYAGLSRNEIAEMLDISEKTVDNHLALATKKIREFLIKYGLL